MPNVCFRLVSTSNNVIKESHSLQAIWWYIKTTINVPSNYHVEEVDGEDIISIVSALYLIENYKNKNDVPLTVTDIP